MRTGWPVAAVARQDDGWWVTAADGRREGPFAAVVDAAPAHAAARHQGDPEVRSLLAGIRYNPLVVVAVAFDRAQVRHALDGFGMLTPSGERRPLLGVLWDSSTWRHRAPAGKHLLRCMSGDPAWLDLDDDEVVRRTVRRTGRDLRRDGQPASAPGSFGTRAPSPSTRSATSPGSPRWTARSRARPACSSPAAATAASP